MQQKLTLEEQDKLEELCASAFDFARQNDKESLEILLNAGLNVNLANHKGNTLLMLAAYNNSFEVTKMLLERGAEVDKRNDRNQTPLAGVCFKGYYDIAKLLVEYGADVDADNGMGLTPLNCAIMFRRTEILELLRQHSKQSLSFFQKIGLWFFKKIKK
ncbi:hypothetical protein BBW65_07595 [Helicobacter enhydrae]|uniref:Uncharacterized protein n=1 Tax=Helicobacter enhydrae TaxID=222136 RepID=A0A1B1U7B5_9HELI|nr:ankyrin repeat domain-containing protein [Helicobacter enhydrae]ANV98668.1 hypothetical protein BBW65_07595 [Helicobacter enhydrae]